MVLLIMLCRVVLTLDLWMKSLNVRIQVKTIEQYFRVALFIMLYKVVLTLESVGEFCKCGYSC